MKKIIVLALVGMILLGCSTKKEEKVKVLTIAQIADITTFDPQDAFNKPTDMVFENMFSHLLVREYDNAQTPDAAESVENIDSLTWRVKLRKGITFHNGDPLTAADVKFTFERVATDETLQVHPYYNPIQEVRIIDDYTCDVITKVPMPTFKIMTSFSGSWILPKKYIETNGWDHFMTHPIGSGPYKFVEWVRDDRVVLVPYENYFQGKATEWEKVVFRAIPESSTRVGELLTGGVDLAISIPPNEWSRVNKNEATELRYGVTSHVPVLILRLTKGFVTADPLVREAMEYAINRTKIAKELYQGAATHTRTRMTPGCFGSQTLLYEKDLYNLEQAKALLAKSSYKGEPITFSAGRGRYNLDGELAEMIAGMLGEAGFNVKLEISDWSAFVDIYRSKSNKELLLIGLSDSLYDSSDSLLHYTIKRAAGQTDYVNEETNRLFFEAGQNLNVKEREAQYQRIQDIVAEERPHIPVVQRKDIYGVQKNIQFTPALNGYVRAIKVKAVSD